MSHHILASSSFLWHPVSLVPAVIYFGASFIVLFGFRGCQKHFEAASWTLLFKCPCGKMFCLSEGGKNVFYQLLIDENVHLITFTSDGFERCCWNSSL